MEGNGLGIAFSSDLGTAGLSLRPVIYPWVSPR